MSDRTLSDLITMIIYCDKSGDDNAQTRHNI